MNYKYYIIIFMLICSSAAGKPLAGTVFLEYNTGRGKFFSGLAEKHCIQILNNTGIFSTINEGIINRELKKFICIDEKCILNFSQNAGIHLLINGSIDDRDKYIVLNLKAYGTASPFSKKLLCSYRAKIDLNRKISSTAYSLIIEEHSGRFISKVLEKFIYPVEIIGDDISIKANTELQVNGRYRLYKNEPSLEKAEKYLEFKNNLSLEKEPSVANGDFIYLSFKDKSKELYSYYVNGKNSLVFEKPHFYDTLFIFFFTVPGSATMPISAPILGYFNNDDWKGLGLWGINAAPYLYAETRGFRNSPGRLKKRNKNISKDDRALNYFAWYMLLAGGTPLFIDSFASNYLYDASNFHPKQKLMGNPWTAFYLSAISNGGGMFYRGYRTWGYFYFHLNNILLYSTLREFSHPEKRNPHTGIYEKGKNNKKKGAIIASALAVSKTVEIIHTLITNENIKNGTVDKDYMIPEIFLTSDPENKPVYNLGFTFKY